MFRSNPSQILLTDAGYSYPTAIKITVEGISPHELYGCLTVLKRAFNCESISIHKSGGLDGS